MELHGVSIRGTYKNYYNVGLRGSAEGPIKQTATRSFAVEMKQTKCFVNFGTKLFLFYFTLLPFLNNKTEVITVVRRLSQNDSFKTTLVANKTDLFQNRAYKI